MHWSGKSVVTDHKKNEEKTTTTYSYDSAGNRTKKVQGEEETAYTYNGLNQLLKAKTTKRRYVKAEAFLMSTMSMETRSKRPIKRRETA